MFRLKILLILLVVLSALVAQAKESPQFLVVLGIAQDAGYPQIGSAREFEITSKNPALKRRVVALGLVDKSARQKWLFEATPDITEQLFILNKRLPTENTLPDGIFLTHAHIGHYTGLIYLGREAIGAKSVPVYTMPRMQSFLTENAPWSQLVALKNIETRILENETLVKLNDNLEVRPFLVPHRDEFSETVGYEIIGRKRRAIFIPDIDKWSKWNKDLKELIEQADYALIDATFYKNGEIPNRDMSEIPHPFVEESMTLLQNLPAREKAKVIFIHFNHTNPLIRDDSRESREVMKKGFRVATEGMILEL